MRVLVAGATGAVGQQLVPQLVAAGHQVWATTRSPAKLDGLRAAGAEPVLMDGLEGQAVSSAVMTAGPEVIVHEMTAIPAELNFRRFGQTFAATNELRTRGLDLLLAAATAQGVRRFIAQSYAGWPNILAPDFVATVTSNDPAVSPSVDSTGLIVTVPLPSGWVESTTTPLEIAYATTSASTGQALSATITPSAPVTLASSISFAQTT